MPGGDAGAEFDGYAAVDCERLAGDEAGGVGDGEGEGVGDGVRRCCGSVRRHRLRCRPVHCGPGESKARGTYEE